MTVGIFTTILSPLASVFLSVKYNDGIPACSRFAMDVFDFLKERWIKSGHLEKVKQLAVLAGELGVSLPALAIAWCIKNPNVTTAILGATRKEQLLENLKAIDVLQKLDAGVMEKMEGIVQTKPVLPEH